MNLLFVFFFFVLGAIIGGFLNVVINRLNTGRHVNGRSFCPNCAKKINWYDLVPILSWIFLKGKCRNCHSKISIQYPLVEFFTGILFVLTYLNFEILLYSAPLFIFILFFSWVAIIFSILIVIFVYDLKHKIIPDFFSYIFAIMAFIQTLVLLPFSQFAINIFAHPKFYLDLFAGIIFFTPFFLLWYFSNGKWIGLGDGKLAIGIGWFLGFTAGLNAIILAFWLGSIFAIFFLLIFKLKYWKKNIRISHEIPFGPFLILATIIQFFFRIDFLGISLFLK